MFAIVYQNVNKYVLYMSVPVCKVIPINLVLWRLYAELLLFLSPQTGYCLNLNKIQSKA